MDFANIFPLHFLLKAKCYCNVCVIQTPQLFWKQAGRTAQKLVHHWCGSAMLWGLGRKLTSGLTILLSSHPFLLLFLHCCGVAVRGFPFPLSLFWICTCTAKRNELASNLLNAEFLPRLLLTCLSQPEVANVWVERIRENPSVYDCVCFIMSSSTNGKLPKQAGMQWVFAEGK